MSADSTRAGADIAGFEQRLGTATIVRWETVVSPQQAQIQRAIVPNQSPAAIVYPTTSTELAAAISAANPSAGGTASQRWQVLPCGAGSKLGWGGLLRPDPDAALLVVSTARMNQLVEHAVGDLTVTVEAGMRFTDLQAVLAKAGQFLAIDPAYPEQATIGGIVATGDMGSLRQRYGSVRDRLLGISFVRADGQMAKAGGRVVKNVAGYDLMKLFIGSYGTLGILTQVTLRVYPLPEASQTVVLTGDPVAIAQATATLMTGALTPTIVDVLSAQVSPADKPGVLLAVQFQGIPASVEQQTRQLHEIAEANRLEQSLVTGSDETALWQQWQNQLTECPQPDGVTCKIGVRPAKAVVLLDQLAAIAPDALAQIHVGSGLGRLTLSTATLDTLHKLRLFCQESGGFLTVLDAPINLKQQIDVWGYPGNALKVMQTLKQQFDPTSLLSPHRFVGGI